MAAVRAGTKENTSAADTVGLVAWAERSGRQRTGRPARGGLRFAFYGRVSTEDWQDPVTSRARQREQAGVLVRGHGQIVAEFFDVGQTRKLAWACRPQSAALVAQLADPGRGWEAIVIGEYERAFYGSQYASMAPLFEHYGVQLWTPEAGGRVDFKSEHDEKTMTMLGLSSKREITRTSIRVRAVMAVQTREQGRYLGGRPPYGYRLADAGPVGLGVEGEPEYVVADDLACLVDVLVFRAAGRPGKVHRCLLYRGERQGVRHGWVLAAAGSRNTPVPVRAAAVPMAAMDVRARSFMMTSLCEPWSAGRRASVMACLMPCFVCSARAASAC